MDDNHQPTLHADPGGPASGSAFLQLPVSGASFLLLCVAALLLPWRLWSLRLRPALPLPPTPGPALPLLGHLHLLVRQDPRQAFRAWRAAYGDVFGVYMGAQLVVVLNGYDVIHEALAVNADVFSDRPHLPFLELVSDSKGLINTSGRLWKDQRRTTVKILRELGVGRDRLAVKVEDEVRTFVSTLCGLVSRGHDCLDLERLAHLTVANNICSVVLGRRFDYDDPEFIHYLDTLDGYVKAGGVSAASFICPALRYVPGDVFQVKKKARLYARLRDSFLQPVLRRQRQRSSADDEGERSEDKAEGGSRDFISAYLHVVQGIRDDDDLRQHVNEHNLQRLVLELFGGGTDTTATALLWALAYLLHHPHVQQRCYDEIVAVVGTDRPPSVHDRPRMTYVEAVVMETLRFSGTSPLAFPHSASRDISLAGHVIPKGTFVLPYLDTALRDPGVWESPDQFRPERFLAPTGQLLRPKEWIPFGTGRRVCIGETLALMELFLYVSTLLQKFQVLLPEGSQPPSLEGIMGITKCPHPFKVRLVQR